MFIFSILINLILFSPTTEDPGN